MPIILDINEFGCRSNIVFQLMPCDLYVIGRHFMEDISIGSGVVNVINELLISMVDAKVLTQALIPIKFTKAFHKSIVNSGAISVNNGPGSNPCRN